MIIMFRFHSVKRKVEKKLFMKILFDNQQQFGAILKPEFKRLTN